MSRFFPSSRRVRRIFAKPRKLWPVGGDPEQGRSTVNIFEEIPAATLEFFRYLRNVYRLSFFFPLVSLPFFWIARRTFSPFCNLKPTDDKGFTKFHRLEPGCRRVIISREKCYPNFGKPALPKANSSSSDGRRGGRGETKGKKKEINYRRRYKRYALNPRTWLLFVLGNESRYHNCDNRASAKRFIETSPGNRQKKFRHGGCTLWDFVVKRWANTTLSRSFCNSCTGIFDATPRSNTMNFIEWLVEWHVNDAFMMAYSKRIEWIPSEKSLK